MAPPERDDGWDDPTWERLQDQIERYDLDSAAARRTYRRLKVAEIVVAAAIPFFAGFQNALAALLPAGLGLLPAVLIAALGIVIVVLEGLLHLNQYQRMWLACGATCEALKREKFLFLADAGPYSDIEDKRGHLAERIEELISGEQARWVAARLRAA